MKPRLESRQMEESEEEEEEEEEQRRKIDNKQTKSPCFNLIVCCENEFLLE